MTTEPLTLYKLIILYMVDRVSFPLTKAQIADFLAEHNYTDFMNVQKAVAELTEAEMLTTRTIRNRTQLFITDEGKATLSFFEQDISGDIRQEIDLYLKENRGELRDVVSVTSDYKRNSYGLYETDLIVKDKNVPLVTLRLCVPTEEEAARVCENWQEKNQQLYQYLVEQLY